MCNEPVITTRSQFTIRYNMFQFIGRLVPSRKILTLLYSSNTWHVPALVQVSIGTLAHSVLWHISTPRRRPASSHNVERL